MGEDDAYRHAGQVIVAGFAAGDPPRELLEALSLRSLAGVILFKRNVSEPAEVARRVRMLADAAPEEPPLVAVDQEGGRVQRFGPPLLSLPPMRVLGEIDDVELTRAAARVLGRQLAALGINVDFAPVLDVATNPANEVIGDRAFGSDPERVARHGCAFARGLADAGVLACGKHFPGHGDTLEDSHLELPVLPHDMARLEAVEFVPFRAAVGVVGSIMTAHILFRALDPSRPATLSPVVIEGLLRKELGYEGLVVSDDLEMRAVADRWPAGAAAVEAIAAGCDLVLICKRTELVAEARDALAERARADGRFAARLADAAERVRRVRASLTCAPITDTARLAEVFADPEAARVREAIG